MHAYVHYLYRDFALAKRVWVCVCLYVFLCARSNPMMWMRACNACNIHADTTTATATAVASSPKINTHSFVYSVAHSIHLSSDNRIFLWNNCWSKWNSSGNSSMLSGSHFRWFCVNKPVFFSCKTIFVINVKIFLNTHHNISMMRFHLYSI